MHLRFTLILVLVTNIGFAQNKWIEKKTSSGYETEKGYIDSDSLKTGLWQRINKSGKILEEQDYKKGKKDGVQKVYFNNGQISDLRNYKDGKYYGKLIRYYENGVKRSEGTWENGNHVGEHTEYYENGTVSKIEKFDKLNHSFFVRSYDKDGRLYEVKDIDKKGNGISEITKSDGTVVAKEIYKDFHRITEKRFYDSGIIKEENQYGYEKGSDNSTWLQKKYDKTGKLRNEHLHYTENDYYKVYGDSINEIYHYEKNTGSSLYKTGYFESHYFNGQIAEQGNFKKDSKDGLWKTFYKNGQLKFIGKFVSYNPELKDSTHTYYYPNGQVEKIENYKIVSSKYTDVLKSNHVGISKTFYKNGNLKEMSDYGDQGDSTNKLHGKYVSYYENGKLKLEGIYNNGNLTAPYKSYYENGNLKESVAYISLDSNDRLIKTYYENGILASEINDSFDWKDEKKMEYFENGKIKYSKKYEDGIEKECYYYQLSANKIAQKNIYPEDRKIVQLFYPNGKKMAEITTKNENPNNKDVSVFNTSGKKVSFNEFASLGKDLKIKDYVLLYSENAYVIDIEFEFENSGGIKVFKKTFQ